MKKNGDSRTRSFERPATTTHRRHPPLIDPMVLIILMLPILVLLFLYFLSYVPKSIKPTSFKSTFNLFYLFLVLLASLFHVLNHEDNESPTNEMVESYQDQDDIDVNDESHFYDAAMHVAVNSSTGSTPSKTSKLPPRPPQQPEAQHYDRNSPSSSTAQSAWTPQPERQRPTPQPQPEPRHYDRQSSMSSSSESSYIAQPPPLPPFDMLESSPDIQPMGQPSTSMDGGDSFCSSPSVNAKADIFISKRKGKWKMEQKNKVKKKGGSSSVNKPKINGK